MSDTETVSLRASESMMDLGVVGSGGIAKSTSLISPGEVIKMIVVLDERAADTVIRRQSFLASPTFGDGLCRGWGSAALCTSCGMTD